MVSPLEFNGREDSLFQPYNEENQRYMEYVEFLGTYADVPVTEILLAWRKVYGEERVNNWIRMCEEQSGDSFSDFEREDVWREEESLPSTAGYDNSMGNKKKSP